VFHDYYDPLFSIWKTNGNNLLLWVERARTLIWTLKLLTFLMASACDRACHFVDVSAVFGDDMEGGESFLGARRAENAHKQQNERAAPLLHQVLRAAPYQFWRAHLLRGGRLRRLQQLGDQVRLQQALAEEAVHACTTQKR